MSGSIGRYFRIRQPTLGNENVNLTHISSRISLRDSVDAEQPGVRVTGIECRGLLRKNTDLTVIESKTLPVLLKHNYRFNTLI